MFNPHTSFKPPKISKKDEVLKKHNAYFKYYGNRKILVSPTEKIIESIPENESIKDTFIRLGWIDRDGKIL